MKEYKTKGAALKWIHNFGENGVNYFILETFKKKWDSLFVSASFLAWLCAVTHTSRKDGTCGMNEEICTFKLWTESMITINYILYQLPVSDSVWGANELSLTIYTIIERKSIKPRAAVILFASSMPAISCL